METLPPATPVVLFTYKRTDVLGRTLECLRENRVPLLIAYSDGAKSELDEEGVNSVRKILKAIDWCEVELHERKHNLGLGKNIVAGVTDVFKRFDSALIWEDDLICVPGTYDYLCAALKHYQSDLRVMSVTGWTNRHILPKDVGEEPYFDGRAECWVWGTWRRSWESMESETAMDKLRASARRGRNPAEYGGDLPYMAKQEKASNIWAVRWLYHHILHDGLCLRPPWSMVEHIGTGEDATNAAGISWLNNGTLEPCPPIPDEWPHPIENRECARLHRRMCPRPWSDRFPYLVATIRKIQKLILKR